MQSLSKNWGATNTPKCLAENNRAYASDHTSTLQRLQELRDIAWHYAMKYRWDPVLGRAHDEYLTMLNRILKEIEA